MKVVVLKVHRPYDFTDQNGRQVKGFKISYVPLDMVGEEGNLGVPFLIDKSISDTSLRGVFLNAPVPGVYDLTVRTSYNARNHLIEVISGISFDRNLVVNDLVK